MDIFVISLLCLAAFIAGFIDAIVGGGGLIQTPMGIILMPNLPVATIIGTLKIPSFSGTFFAAVQETGVAIGTVVALGSAPILTGVLSAVLFRSLPTRTWMLATAAATTARIRRGTRTPPAEEEAASSTTTGASITGAAMLPANAVEAAAVRAAARTSFFMLSSRNLRAVMINSDDKHPRLTSYPV